MIDNVRGALFHARAFRVSRALADRMLRAEALGLEAIFRGCAGALGRRRARSLLLELEALFPEGLPDRARAWREVALAVTSMQGAPTIEAAARIKAAEKLFVDLQEGDAWAVSSCRVIRALTLRIVGDLQGLRVVIPELIADADRRNDRYVYATIARGGFTLWKADDTPERGRALLRSPELAWPRVDGSFHLQEWVGLEAACELSLYEGRGMQAWEEHRRDLGRLGRAPFNLLIQSVRILVGYLIGRLEVVRAEATRSTTAALNARRYAIQLGLEGTSYASARSELLFAGLASTSARTDKMLRHLQRAERHAELGQLPLVGAISKFLIGRAEGGDGGRDRAREAEATLRALSIKDPARFVVSEVAAMERLV